MKKIIKISGIAYAMIFIAGFYSNFAVLESLVDSINPTITTANFINNHSQFGIGLLGFVMMLFFDILLVWSLIGLTKSVNKKITYIASLFRFIHALFLGIAIFKLWNIYLLTANGSISETLKHSVMILLIDFDSLWTIGLLFFGIHLIVLGYLVLKSVDIPKALGVLLSLAAIGYIIDSLAKLFMSSYIDYKDVFEIIVVMPSVIGEFSFTIWLLVNGFRKQTTQQISEMV